MTKNFFCCCCFLLLSLLFSLSMNTASAQDIQWNDWNGMQWNLDGSVLRLKGDRTDKSDAAYPWTQYKYQVESVIIEDGTTEIGDAYFREFVILDSIIIPETVTFIGYDAFSNCKRLSNVILPDGISYIGHSAFFDCDSLISIKMPENIENILSSTFSNCDALQTVYLPTSGKLTSLEVGAFGGCHSLESIIIPESVISIGSSTFYGCDNLKTISITRPSNLTTIDHWAFYGCSSLESLSLPESLTEIGSQAFYGCSNLKNISISLPSNLKTIRYNAFEECHNLKSITLPESLESIDSNVFYYCDNLTFVEIPSSLTSIGAGIFSNSGLTNVIIPEGIISIESSAFRNCYRLKNVSISNSVNAILDYAFSSCPIDKVIIPDNVKYIAPTAFDKKVPIYAHAGSYAAQWAIDNGHDLYIMNDDGTITTPSKFIIDENNVLVGYIGDASDIVIPDNVVKIDQSVFENNGTIVSVTIPGSVELVDFYAFKGCENLTDVIIKDGVKEIEYQAFMDCKNLKNVSIPNSVTWIHGFVFSGCESLESISLPDSINLIDYNTFENCTNLKSITIPNGVEKIYSNAFNGCIGLTNVQIPDTVTWMDDYVFAGCSSLDNITIPKSVTSIGYNAIDTNTTITAYCNSYAAQWAIENNRTLKYIDVCVETPTEETTTPEPTEETTTPEPTEETTTPEPTEETVTPDPTEETTTPEPTEKTVTPEPTEETTTPEPTEETTTPGPTEETVTPEPTEGSFILEFILKENGKKLKPGDTIHASAKFSDVNWIRNAMVMLAGQDKNIGITLSYNPGSGRWEGSTVVSESWTNGQYYAETMNIYDFSGNRLSYNMNDAQSVVIAGGQGETDPEPARNVMTVEVQNLNQNGSKSVPEDLEEIALKMTILLQDDEMKYTSEQVPLSIFDMKLNPKLSFELPFTDKLPEKDKNKLTVKLIGLPEFVYGYTPVEHKYFLTSNAWINNKGNIEVFLIWADEIYFGPKDDGPVAVGLPEDEIGAYTMDEDGTKHYLIYQTYDICMQYLGSEELCSGNQRCYHK